MYYSAVNTVEQLSARDQHHEKKEPRGGQGGMSCNTYPRKLTDSWIPANISNQTPLCNVTKRWKVMECYRQSWHGPLTFSVKDTWNTCTESQYPRLTIRKKIYKMCVYRELTWTCNLWCHQKVCVFLSCYWGWSHVLHCSTVLTAL
jgi:hypothetical protein